MTKQKSRMQDLAHRYRPREKAAQRGLGALTNTELLALMIGSGQAKYNALVLARKVEQVLQNNTSELLIEPETQQQLQTIFGIGAITAQKILASLEFWQRLAHTKASQSIDSPSKIYALASKLTHKKQEYCLAFYLNGRQELIHQQTIAIGGLNYNFLEARDIFGPAFIHGAASLILVHNHPSGNQQPSSEDLLFTEKIAQLAELLGYALIDHLIVSRRGYCSLRETHQELFISDPIFLQSKK